MDSLGGDAGPLEGCRRIISDLEALLPAQHALSTESNTKVILNALAWPLKESKAKKLLEELGEYKSTITLALTTDSV